MNNFKLVGAILSVACLIFLCILLGTRKVGIEKKQEVDGTMGRVSEEEYSSDDEDSNVKMVAEGSGYDVPNDVLQKENDTQLNIGNSSDNGEEGNVETEVISSQVSQGNFGNSEISETEKIGNTEGKEEMSLKLIDSLSIVSKASADVLISSKNVYLLDNSVYAYALKLIFPIENTGYKLVDYMCSVTTWNSVNSGDSIHVEYGLDKDNNIIILSLAKND